jgi:GTP-binding protein
LYEFPGLKQVDTPKPLSAMCALAGIGGVSIGDTITDPENPRPLPRIALTNHYFDDVLHQQLAFAGKEGN